MTVVTMLEVEKTNDVDKDGTLGKNDLRAAFEILKIDEKVVRSKFFYQM